jgi:hypothetical protein
MESTSEIRGQPLPPVHSRRAVLAREGGRAPTGAPLPPYVPGRSIALSHADAVELLEPAGLSEPDELPRIDAIDTDDAEVVLGGWQAGEETEGVLGGWQAGEGSSEDPVDAAFAQGEDFPFEPGEDEPEELVLEAVAEAPDQPEPTDPAAFPWELTEAASTPMEGTPSEVAAEADETAPERSPWEELREAAAQSIGASEDDDQIVAGIDLSAAMDSADAMAGEFADRLEALAERLRTEGLRAIDRALTEGDRLDTAVAGFLTAFIAARDR